MSQPIGTSEYWNKRVKGIPDRKDMLFLDPRREEYWKRVRNFLNTIADKKVLDVCCGFGQFASLFSDYEGMDFSEEMLKLAKEDNPGKKFTLQDGKLAQPNTFDVIFEVNSLHSMGLTPQEFYDIHEKQAKQMVACLEADKFTIFQKYAGR